MVAPVISILSDTSEESMGSHAPRVILFGAIPAIIPAIPKVPIVPADPIVTPEVGTVSVVSPSGVLDLVDYSPSSDSDLSEDSDPPAPDLPLVSPFLCSDDTEADDESGPAKQRPVSLSHDTLAPLSEFPLAPIWIIESSCVSDRWWTKVPEIIPRALSWRRKAKFNQYEYFGELFRKAPIELAPTKDEVQCNWYAPSNDYFMWYVPRKPPVSMGGLYREYMNKRSAARAARKKSSKDFHPSECVREASLIDRVSTFYPSRVVENQEILKKVVPQIEYYLQSTSEDEQDIKDHTSPKQHYKYTYISMQEDQIIRLVDQRQHDHISKMTKVSEHKIQSGIQRLYNHREARLNKIAKEDKQRKCIGHMNSSVHMKLAIERYVPKKRKYVDVLRSLFCALPKISNVPSIEQLANQKNDLSRPFKRIDKIFLSHELHVFLSRAVVGRCKFPWCNDITVDRSFWNGLCALDDNRKGWMLDEMVSKRIFPLALDDPLQSAALHIG
ncbi:hypothetical protein Tco_1401869 [Tanacetum coccineum]